MAKVTFTPITGFAAFEPSVTRMASSSKDCPAGTIWGDPLTVSSVHNEEGVENKVKVWHGELFGATQALTCTSAF
jgi:hypothetical protein